MIAGRMLSPGTAYLLAYLPARRAAHIQRLGLFDRHAATVDTSAQHGIEFSRQLRAEESRIAEAEARLADLTCQARIELPPIPRTTSELQPWLAALSERVGPYLTTPVHEAAWKAGEMARRIAVAVALSAYTAYLRCATPEDADLRAEVEDCARDLKDSASMLTVDLNATGLPLVISQADNVAEMVSLTRDLTPTTIDGYRKLYMLVGDLHLFLEGKARQLDVAPPPKASSPPSAEEEALLARIIATPHDLRLRLELAALAEPRNDPRGTLIKLQLTGIEDDDADKASDLISAHPEWTARLRELGATDIKFAGGFPDDIRIDAAALLSRGADLLAAAPLRRLRVRGAKGKVGDIVRSLFLGTLDSLDLDNQAVTDDDVIALAASPHAARLRQLDLRHNPITARGVESIAASPHLKRLEVVNLDGNPADPVDRVEYYDETHTHAVPTDAGKALEAKYGPLRWLRRG